MKILLVYEWCEVGGVEAFMVALWKALRAEGHQCELFFFNRGPMAEQLPAGCVAHFGDLTDCMKLVKSQNFEIVHANSSDAKFGISIVRRLGARLVITAHGMVVPSWNSTNCDGFASCSKWQAEEQRRFTDLPIHTVLNGIDLDRFKPSEEATAISPPIVAWVGRSIDMTHKRIDKLAAIAPALRRAGLRLRIADPYGSEAVKKELTPEAAHSLLSAADFWGMVPKERLPDFYQEVAASSGCVLSTSVREGLPMNLIEAQACGCPVIGPDVRGVNEVVDPEHGGVLYEFDMEPEQLANLIVETLNDVERLGWRREACAKRAHEQFSLQRMAQEYIRIYEEALFLRPRRLSIKARARRWLEPLLHWEDYVERRWAAGCSHYEASRKLAEQGEWALAAEAARLSLITSPTIYVRPERLAHLLKTLLRPRPLLSARGRSPVEVRSRHGEPKEVD